VSTPRERVQRYAEAASDGRAKAPYTARCLDGKGKLAELNVDDLKAVLKANEGYEAIMRNAVREGIKEYKLALAKEMHSFARKAPTNDVATALEAMADDLEDGTL